MKKFAKLGLLSLILSLSLNLQVALAAFSGDLAIDLKDISFSTSNFLEGRSVRIYATASNLSSKDLLGVVRFFDNGKQIGGDQAISIFAGKNDGVFIDWAPGAGNHKVSVKIFPWQPELDNPSNNSIEDDIFVVQDTDHDGTPNATDDDDDGDGAKDSEDHFPLNSAEKKDTDGDGKGDNTDTDDDNDGVPDNSDEMPLDPNETLDTDKDGIGNIADTDDDGDGISDIDEENTGTNPSNSDTDADSVTDKKDAFPLDSKEALDTDNDKIGNNSDIDDDNDGLKDTEDPFPLNKPPVIALDDEDFTLDINNEQLFDATPSYDEDGEIVSYQWKVDDEIIKEGNAINIDFNKLGKHSVQLSITDNSGETVTKNFELNVMNLEFYKQIGLSVTGILLAMGIYFKYIAAAKLIK
ncbi:MAG: PKD domain-containing protein [Patescibacteria group bacterium]